jgi:hypothetical protein
MEEVLSGDAKAVMNRQSDYRAPDSAAAIASRLKHDADWPVGESRTFERVKVRNSDNEHVGNTFIEKGSAVEYSNLKGQRHVGHIEKVENGVATIRHDSKSGSRYEHAKVETVKSSRVQAQIDASHKRSRQETVKPLRDQLSARGKAWVKMREDAAMGYDDKPRRSRKKG